MVVDVGAGTTDFSLFASSVKDDRMWVRHVLRSHRSLAVAGNAIDDALVSHALSVARGVNRSGISEELERDKRQLKEDLFRDGAIDRVYGASSIQLALEEFLASVPMQGIIAKIKDTFDGVLEEVLPRKRAGRVVVFFSGGGAALPFLKQLVPVSETSYAHRETGRSGFVRLMYPREHRPRWHDRVGYESLWRACGGERESPTEDYFGRVAVALGGAYYVAGAREWLHLDRPMLWPGITNEAELLRAPLPG